MSDEIEFRVVKVDISDTLDELARENGYESYDALVEKAEAERAELSPAVRAVVEKFDAEWERRVLFGDSDT